MRVWCFDQTKPFTWYISVLSLPSSWILLWNCGEKIHINSFSKFTCKDKGSKCTTWEQVPCIQTTHCTPPIIWYSIQYIGTLEFQNWERLTAKTAMFIFLASCLASSILVVLLVTMSASEGLSWRKKNELLTSIYLQELYITTPWKYEVKVKWSPMNHVW